MIEERYQLAKERVLEIAKEELFDGNYNEYFRSVSTFLNGLIHWYDTEFCDAYAERPIEVLEMANTKFYQDILPDAYEKSYANPEYATKQLGEVYAPVLSALYVEMRSIITSAHERNQYDMVIHLELWIEVYCLFYQTKEELGVLPDVNDVIERLAWFVQDYAKEQYDNRVEEQFDPTNQFAVSLIQTSDLSDPRYLYQFGEYITQYEIEIAQYLASLPEETIAKMADTFTNGYQMGFVLGKKDLSKKEVANIRYVLGFERVVKRAIHNFAQMGLEVTIYRAGNNIFHRKGMHKIGYHGAVANRQYEYDHREDDALVLDKKMLGRKLEVLRSAYEQVRTWTDVHAGPACIEVFGEEPFKPINKKESITYSKQQQELVVEYQAKTATLVNEFCKPEERSFTIIAFPTPQIGSAFREIFDETIRINTLDYKAYERMQQLIIDELDRADYVRVVGMNGNLTNLTVKLCEITDGTKETKFENCVADVNIPVGEVFTSPTLQGTNGTLHVTKVYLNGLEYRDLTLVFQDGMIMEYGCSNFDSEEEGKTYVKETVMARRETLPMGEFAIGTNTTAYAISKKYGLEDKLPILIAEKTGPHFAIGDTCYSHSEEIQVCNPNGKEVMGRENECSILRHDEARKQEAYFYHHLDITIPYDELQELVAVTKDGEEIPIIENGKFTLQGLEDLNEPLNCEKLDRI